MKVAKKLLAEAARSDSRPDPNLIHRFIELRLGIEGELGAERHQLVMGRRGTGKSTLLHVVKDRLTAEGVSVATVDMETFNGREYPDVLIEILIELLGEIRPKVRRKNLIKRLLLLSQLFRVKKILNAALSDPQRLQHRVNVSKASRSGRNAGMNGSVAFKGQGIRGGVSSGTASARTHDAAGEYEELKIQRLQVLVPRISALLRRMVEISDAKFALIFLDDFYFVTLAEQPLVLGYLHQVCKGTGVFLKIGGVGTRLRPFVDGDPPTGMQPGHDVSRLLLDVTLADFATAQQFLEKMLEGVFQQFELKASQLFADEARNRMVLACGGAVARDYITLTAGALDQAVERMNKIGPVRDETPLRIFAVDVQSAMKKQMNLKEQESFGIDAVSEAANLGNRWRDICDFTSKTGDVFILVPQADLDGSDWGNEVQQLENLRLLHRINDTTANSKRWTGVKMVVFMIDLGQAANLRMQVRIPEFWKSTAEFEKLRRAEWVYTQDWTVRQSQARTSLGLKTPRKRKTKTLPRNSSTGF